MTTTRPIVLAAGGTGGHMFPAEALARALLSRGHRVVLVTDARGAAFENLPEVAVERIRAASPGGGLAGKLKGAVELALGTLQAGRLLRAMAPAAVVGFGGYPSVPTVHAARRQGVPIVLHEQNAVLGRANRLLAGAAAVVCTSFPEVAGLQGKPRGRVVLTGNPVRPGILALRDRPYPAPLGDGPLNLLITGGSQGAAVFGTVIPAAVEMLPEDLRLRLRVVQQARHETMAEAHALYDRIGVEAEIAPFFRDMPERLSACHMMIARAGASTVAELAVAGRPALLVPYPHATDDHQAANARQMVEAGGAAMLIQRDFTADRLAAELTRLLADPAGLRAMAAKAHGFGRPDAAERLADAVCHAAGLAGANGNHSPHGSNGSWSAAE